MGQERGLKQKEREEIPVYRVEYHLTRMCLSGNFIICKLGLSIFLVIVENLVLVTQVFG